MLTKSTVIAALRAFIRQRPGLEFCNYGDVAAYRAEMRQITKDRHHAEALLAAVAFRDSITAEQIIEASKHAFSGRLSITIDETGCYTADGFQLYPSKIRIEYCTGQYFPTEYRKAACAVLASVLWDHWRDQPDVRPSGDALRKYARDEFGRSIANRYFH